MQDAVSLIVCECCFWFLAFRSAASWFLIPEQSIAYFHCWRRALEKSDFFQRAVPPPAMGMAGGRGGKGSASDRLRSDRIAAAQKGLTLVGFGCFEFGFGCLWFALAVSSRPKFNSKVQSSSFKDQCAKFTAQSPKFTVQRPTSIVQSALGWMLLGRAFSLYSVAAGFSLCWQALRFTLCADPPRCMSRNDR